MAHKPINNKPINDFRLQAVNGKFISLKNYPNAKGFIVVFIANHCPFAKLYYQRLNLLNKKYKLQGMPLLAISSTDTLVYEDDSFEKMKEIAKKSKFNFPYLYDGLQIVAKNFSAQRTPHAFVIWNENNQWVIKYNGAIDDNGANPEKVQHNYLADALDALLYNKPIGYTETRSVGCEIHFRK